MFFLLPLPKRIFGGLPLDTCALICLGRGGISLHVCGDIVHNMISAFRADLVFSQQFPKVFRHFVYMHADYIRNLSGCAGTSL